MNSAVPPPPPPPPPPPGSNINFDPNQGGENLQDLDLDSEDLKEVAPKVSGAPAKIFYVLGGFLLFAMGIAYIVFSGKEKKEDELKDQKPKTIARETDALTLAPPPPPTPLPPRKLLLPPPPQVPVIAPPVIPAPPVSPEKKEADNKARKDRLASPMMVKTQGSSNSSSSANEENDAFAASDPNLAFANKAMKASKTEKAYATRIKNMNTTVAQGKLINAVLESAINTQLPGQIRALVSHDIYAESGRTKLIPKGSRVIGTYNTSMFNGQSRVFIIWTRIIRPDGIDIMVNSPGTDMLGRAGLSGNLDNRYYEIFMGAVLSSMVGIGIADFAEKGLGMDTNGQSTTDAEGNTTSNSSASSQATSEAVQNITDTSKKIVQEMIDARPVITIDQGTPINIFVNRDLIFPASVVNSAGYIN